MLKKVTGLLVVLAIAAGIAQVAQSTLSSSIAVEPKHERALHGIGKNVAGVLKPRQLQTQVLTVTSTVDEPKNTFASLHCELLMREYLGCSLSSVAADMFAPISYQMAFASTVNHEVDDRGNTLLHLASRLRDPFFTWQLLELGASTSARNCSNKRPIDFLRPGIAEADQFLFSALTPSSPWDENFTAVPYDRSSDGRNSRMSAGTVEENTSPDRPAMI